MSTSGQSATSQSGSGTHTIQVNQQDQSSQEAATIRLTAKTQKKKVVWNKDTVDNEGMGRKSSKCCCIYRKPHKFGESSSDSEQEDCDHCRGHVEKRPGTSTKKT